MVSEPRPSVAERVIATYGHEWEIWRDLRPNGTQGPWHARRWSDPQISVTAHSISALGEFLADHVNPHNDSDPGPARQRRGPGV